MLMKQFLLVAVLSGLCVQHSFSQAFVALQAEVAEPTEEFRQSAGTGYGAKATYMRYLTTRFALAGSVGYIRWASRSNLPPNNEYKVVAIPVSLGASFLLSKNIIAPYIGLAVSFDYMRVRGIAPNATTYEDKNELHFAFTPHVGVGVHVVGPIGILLTGSYNVIYTSPATLKYFGLGIGVAAGL